MRSTALLLPSFVVSLVALACSPPPLGTETEGDKAVVKFAYSGRDCVFGCALDRAALQGSAVNVSVSGPFDERTKARSSDPAIAKIATQEISCSEDKTCTISLSIETTLAGDPKLEIIGASGSLVDSAVLHVRPAARIDVKVGGGTEQGVDERLPPTLQLALRVVGDLTAHQRVDRLATGKTRPDQTHRRRHADGEANNCRDDSHLQAQHEA